MSKFILGKKLGMTQVFGEKGEVTPVTVVEAGPCFVVQVKGHESDGYQAVQIGLGEQRKNKATKPQQGHFKKAGVAPQKVLREFRVENVGEFQPGQEIKCDVFEVGDMVDVTAKTRGRGFTGVIQRWNHSRIAMTHGAGPVHRHVGSMGANSDPSRVFKNKKMAGQYGHERVTIQNLEIVKVDVAKNCLLIKGGIPGPAGCLVTVKTAKKAAAKK